MLTLQIFLGVSLCALLILGTHGYPVQGSEYDQSSSGSHTGGHHDYHQEAGSNYAPMYSGQTSGVSSMPGAGYPVFMPVEYPSSSQTEAAQSSQPETKWSVNPKTFSEEGLANTEAVDSSDFVPAPHPPVPYGPVLQSGETSNVMKEAELGNYQQETEELGYPNDYMTPGGGLEGYPGSYPYPYLYPVFDYRLLYGLYPPGTYTTFSNSHEKGKDYFQDVHYLREHGPVPSDVPSRPGQQKIIPRAPQSS